jgi:GNAT superfamily N-acetyltransferase
MVRDITREDIPEVIELMKAFAAYDGSTEHLTIDKESLEKAYFEDDPIILRGILAIEGSEIVGFLNYYYTFSSYALKKCLWVEDAFILSDFRGQGIGRALFHYAKDIAEQNECIRLEWLVRSQNDLGRMFYSRLGASIDEKTIQVKWIL